MTIIKTKFVFVDCREKGGPIGEAKRRRPRFYRGFRLS